MMNSQQNTQMGSGLTRYRSAPCSYFDSLLSSDGGFGADDFAQLFNPRASSPETQMIFSRFMNSTDAVQETSPSNMAKTQTQDHQQQLQQQSSNNYSFANHNSEAAATESAAVDSMFASFNSSFAQVQPKIERPAPATSSLIRHSSSPAGLFANINIREFKTRRGVGSYGGGMDYSTRHTSSVMMMDTISEIGSKGMGENGADDAQFNEDNANDVDDYITGLPVNSWDDHYLKGGVPDNENKRFLYVNASDHDQKNEAANRPKTLLSHHLSLPKSSAELSAMEKLLQDSVPCKIRAKRGCATHPRSIAERVRRTKISERMRRLQELVPNMEKQTNTSDMLDLAVDYIKELQRQLKTLSDNQAKCNCSAKQQS